MKRQHENIAARVVVSIPFIMEKIIKLISLYCNQSNHAKAAPWPLSIFDLFNMVTKIIPVRRFKKCRFHEYEYRCEKLYIYIVKRVTGNASVGRNRQLRVGLLLINDGEFIYPNIICNVFWFVLNTCGRQISTCCMNHGQLGTLFRLLI